MTERATQKIAILISGNGTNMEAIARAKLNGELSCEIVAVISDNPKAPGLAKAARYGIPTFVNRYGTTKSREENEADIIQTLDSQGVDWIVLAGFMRILSPSFVHKYRGRIVNIHPSLLPAFPGAQAIDDALAAQADYTGVTVHIVDELVDHGPIIAQEEVAILPGDDSDSLAARIHEVEHRIYPKALNELINEDY